MPLRKLSSDKSKYVCIICRQLCVFHHPKTRGCRPGILGICKLSRGSRSVSMKLQGGCAIHRHKSSISSETTPCHREVEFDNFPRSHEWEDVLNDGIFAFTYLCNNLKKNLFNNYTSRPTSFHIIQNKLQRRRMEDRRLEISDCLREPVQFRLEKTRLISASFAPAHRLLRT